MSRRLPVGINFKSSTKLAPQMNSFLWCLLYVEQVMCLAFMRWVWGPY